MTAIGRVKRAAAPSQCGIEHCVKIGALSALLAGIIYAAVSAQRFFFPPGRKRSFPFLRIPVRFPVRSSCIFPTPFPVPSHPCLQYTYAVALQAKDTAEVKKIIEHHPKAIFPLFDLHLLRHPRFRALGVFLIERGGDVNQKPFGKGSLLHLAYSKSATWTSSNGCS